MAKIYLVEYTRGIKTGLTDLAYADSESEAIDMVKRDNELNSFEILKVIYYWDCVIGARLEKSLNF